MVLHRKYPTPRARSVDYLQPHSLPNLQDQMYVALGNPARLIHYFPPLSVCVCVCVSLAVHSPSHQLQELRLTKSPAELVLMRRAADIACLAFTKVKLRSYSDLNQENKNSRKLKGMLRTEQ